ncbi:GNAT family N-acetyltransferase [Stackebrandtia nassauensis]|uniref:GCN5-related N-acetyltransferase n=1 Tax=Stackebrandtia nassauensis (strain DSM 44728 / CIP 108903 / NRRL B-16338 / NBRC 102104 / LLR-40K-21) TaxID=446470 RepID=D3Q013_STANL|nr:GNAT family N-acetyltransferase [Stackebrandtia nassauensis]ADD45542.1 GCN5-related N-acetyltransferase [Stackebrandtia nassauensis DSM 44728]
MRPEFRLESYDSEVVRHLNTAVQREYHRRYGGGDETVLAAADFVPPNGAFFVAYLDGEPVASGAWRSHGESDAEMKRLYVVDTARGLGLARSMVALLEENAAAAGRARMILETGTEQPEALALYASLGYAPVEPFGFYANEEGARHLGKALSGHNPHLTHKTGTTAA